MGSLEVVGPRGESGRVGRERVVIPSVPRAGRPDVVLKQTVADDVPAAFGLIAKDRIHLGQFGERVGVKYKNALEYKRRVVTDPDYVHRLDLGIWNADDVLVGNISLTPDYDNPRVGIIGCYLAKEYEGRGYAQTAVETLAERAFADWDYTELNAIVHKDNTRSAKTFLKAGFTPDDRENDTVLFYLLKPFTLS